MFSAFERTGSYKMWSQVLPAVSRGIFAKVFLDFLAALLAVSFGFIVLYVFSVLIRCVYCMLQYSNIISTGQEIMVSWYCVVREGYIALGKTC